MPCFCGVIDGGSKKKTAFQRIVDDMWKEKCKNVSGVEVDFERNDRLHSEFKDCRRNAIDENQLRQDVASLFPNFNFNSVSNFTLSDRQKMDLIAVNRKCVFWGASTSSLPKLTQCFVTGIVRK